MQPENKNENEDGDKIGYGFIHHVNFIFMKRVQSKIIIYLLFDFNDLER